MKILVLSLLRLGDFYLHKNLLPAIRNKWPSAEIHLLVNDSVSGLLENRNEFAKIHSFPRSHLQKILARDEVPISMVLHEMQIWFKELQAESFSVAYVLSHTEVSARILDVLSIPKVFGVHYRDGNPHLPQSGAENFLQQNSLKPGHQHQLQTLAESLGLQIPPMKDVVRFGEVRRVALQTLSSDAKKNWPLERWTHLFEKLRRTFPHIDFHVLGAPFEKSKLEENFSEENLHICSWAQLEKDLPSFDLLLSVDTSVVHLAAQVGVPVIGLYLGSADFKKSAPYQQHAECVAPKIACFPCAHALPCSQTSHKCAEEISVDHFFEKVRIRIEQRNQQRSFEPKELQI